MENLKKTFCKPVDNPQTVCFGEDISNGILEVICDSLVELSEMVATNDFSNLQKNQKFVETFTLLTQIRVNYGRYQPTILDDIKDVTGKINVKFTNEGKIILSPFETHLPLTVTIHSFFAKKVMNNKDYNILSKNFLELLYHLRLSNLPALRHYSAAIYGSMYELLNSKGYILNTQISDILQEQRNRVLEKLFEDTYSKMVLGLYKSLNNLQEAEDLAQEVFCNLSKKHPLALLSLLRLKRYVNKMVKHAKYSFRGKKSNVLQFQDTFTYKENVIEKRIEDKNVLDEIDRLIEDVLSQNERNIFMDFLNGSSYEELSIMYNKTTTNIGSTIYNARKKIKNVLLY